MVPRHKETGCNNGSNNTHELEGDRLMAGTSDRVSVVSPTLAEKPWGGCELARYGFTLPAGVPIGEALITANTARIISGANRGRTLGEVVSAGPDASLGLVASAAVMGRPLFPLLVKLIDARENLSIQVHPDDDLATVHNQPGKTEAWHVLSAEPGSFLYAGLAEGATTEEFLQAAARLDGSSAALLRRIPAQPNTTILLPAGTVHALGAGVVVYEIQQPSDVTYRLDDWGRVDAAGNPRQMHIDDGAAAMKPELRPDPIPAVELPANEGRRHLLAACDKFALERIALTGGGRCTVEPMESPQVFTVIDGSATAGGHDLPAGQSAVVWPGTPQVMLEASKPTVVLRGWVPDLVAEVAAYTAIPGEHAQALRSLSGPLPDIRQVLDKAQ